MQVKFKRLYSCKLVEDLEKERQKVLMAIKHPGALGADFLDYSLKFYLTKYCQMGLNRRWYDFQKEVIKNHRLDEAGRYDEMTMPEMMSDKSSWTDEDHKVYAALVAAKKERK